MATTKDGNANLPNVSWPRSGTNFKLIVERHDNSPGECCDNGPAHRRRRHDQDEVLVAFDLIELSGKDLRRLPIETRNRMLSKLVRGPRSGIVCNEHYEGDGEIVFQHACKLSCEGIVSKRLGSPYRSGRSKLWVKIKNPKAPAVKREAEEDWGSSHWIKSKIRQRQP